MFTLLLILTSGACWFQLWGFEIIICMSRCFIGGRCCTGDFMVFTIRRRVKKQKQKILLVLNSLL